jgi:hypothetical protein
MDPADVKLPSIEDRRALQGRPADAVPHRQVQTSKPVVDPTAATHQLEADHLAPQACNVFMKFYEYAVDLDLGIITIRLEFLHQLLQDDLPLL